MGTQWANGAVESEPLPSVGQMRLFAPGRRHALARTNHIDLRDLPELPRQEVCDFYLSVRQRVLEGRGAAVAGVGALLSEKSLAEDWNRPEEDEAWQAFQ